MDVATAVSSDTDFAEPCSLPAIRLMVSSIKVPPRSSAPLLSIVRLPSRPNFTHEV